ncbi:DNA/RNA non-specific endonuclease [candidate division KSB1 bacterium]
MKRILISICLIILISSPLFAQISWYDTTAHLSSGIPNYTDTLLYRTYFAVAFNRDLKIPEWVAYRLTPALLEGTQDRTENFRTDPDLPVDKQASLSDYSGSGYDRGHMAPAAVFKRSYDAMSTSFLLTNISPQTDNLNRYDWAYLESDVRDLINARDTTWIFTGCLFLDENNTITEPDSIIGDSVFIPTHIYKAILSKSSLGVFETYAFIMPNQDSTIPGNPEDYNITIDSLENVIGLDYFSKLEDSIENSIESLTASVWPVLVNSIEDNEQILNIFTLIKIILIHLIQEQL